MTVASNAARPARADSVFFPAMAWAMMAVVFTGFAPSWFLRSYIPVPIPLPPLSPLIIVHGTAFTLWMVLFVTQTSLVVANRRDIHRKLGWWGAGLAVAMLALGWMAAVDSLRHGATPVPGIWPATFFAVPIGSLASFVPVVVLGVLNRRRADYHKRYMLISIMVVLIPAAARIPLWYFPQIMPVLFAFAVADIFLLALVGYDFYRRGNIHPATWIGGGILIALEPGRMLIGQTHWWQAFANSLA
jgi:hypothetical protein